MTAIDAAPPAHTIYNNSHDTGSVVLLVDPQAREFAIFDIKNNLARYRFTVPEFEQTVLYHKSLIFFGLTDGVKILQVSGT